MVAHAIAIPKRTTQRCEFTPVSSSPASAIPERSAPMLMVLARERGPQESRAELGARDGVGGDPGGVVVRGPADQAGAQAAPEALLHDLSRLLRRVVDAAKRDIATPSAVEAHDDEELLPLAGALVILVDLPSPRDTALDHEVVPLPAALDVHRPFALARRLAANPAAVGKQPQGVPIGYERHTRIRGGDHEGRRRGEDELHRLTHPRALLVAHAARPATVAAAPAESAAPATASAAPAPPSPPPTPPPPPPRPPRPRHPPRPPPEPPRPRGPRRARRVRRAS